MTNEPLLHKTADSREDERVPAPAILHLSSSPHIRHSNSVNQIMFWVLIALLPPLVSGIVFFGFRALMVTAVSVIVAVSTEWLFCKFQKKAVTLPNLSAVVTGLLLALNLSPILPWWMVAIGAAFAIGVAKMPFGGLGCNFINPALAGWAFLMVSYPAEMSRYVATTLGSMSGIDAMSAATPLAHYKLAIADGTFQALDFQDAIKNLFIGNVGGTIGETSSAAILLGGVILLYKRIIPLRIPLFFIGTVFILSWVFNGSDSYFTTSAIIIPVYQILAGGLFLGAFFMATDTVTSPITPLGKIVFATGCGILTFLIRKYGAYPEGVAFAILLMNLCVPLIERYTRPAIYGEARRRD